MQVNNHMCAHIAIEVRSQHGVSSLPGWPVSYRGLSFSLPPPDLQLQSHLAAY